MWIDDDDCGPLEGEGLPVRLWADPTRVRVSVRRQTDKSVPNPGWRIQVEDRTNPDNFVVLFVAEDSAYFGLINALEDAHGKIDGISPVYGTNPERGFPHPFGRTLSRADLGNCYLDGDVGKVEEMRRINAGYVS